MRGYQIEKNIKFEDLQARLKDCPEPAVGQDEVLVDVYCAGLNFFDLLQIEGKYQHKPPFPYIAGAEFSGIISASSPIPDGCDFVPGKTRVFGAGQGAYAEKIAVDFRKLLEVPHNMGMEEAAGLYVTMPTSYAGLVNRAQIKEGDWVLVHAAAGGVGLAAVQIAKAFGAKVIATASQQAKLDVCKRYGADYLVDYTKEGWQKEVQKITEGHGADIVYDPVGLVVPSLKCIAWNGRIVVVGFAGGSIEKIPANLLLLKNCTAMGVHWGAYIKNEPEAIPGVWGALLELFEQKKVKGVAFEKIFEGLESVPTGLKALGARETWGKAVVRVKHEKERSKL
ncbi:NADPH:quinone oxidoreductase family protein [Sporobolomyces koalae]|uniref:NADPH:quinone oxidoreductase family protein n=1 Tax=Sporobolomyces koalae TaxID=500713 RepID=UPI00316F5CEC